MTINSVAVKYVALKSAIRDFELGEKIKLFFQGILLFISSPVWGPIVLAVLLDSWLEKRAQKVGEHKKEDEIDIDWPV